MKEDFQIKTYVGLDVSVADTHICVLDEEGKMLFESAVPSEPDVIADTIFQHASNCERVAVEIWVDGTEFEYGTAKSA